MLRHVKIIVGSSLALLFFAAPGWTQFRGRGASMGSMPFSHGSGAFVSSGRFPAFGTGTALSSSRGFPAFGTGTFTPTAHSGFASSAGRVVPTANGLAVVSANGTIMPAATSTFRNLNPASFVSPLANTFASQSAYAHTLRQYEREAAWGNYYNPYLYGAYGYSPYGYGFANPYLGYGTSNYGIAPAYGTGFGSGTSNPYVGAGNNANTQVAGNNNVSTSQSKPTDALKAFGIPVEFGEVKWPLALRLMPPDTKRDLLDKLESQMKIAANQAINGNASTVLLRETKSTIDSVKWWLRGRRSNMAESTYQDGDAFLRQLEDSLRRMDS